MSRDGPLHVGRALDDAFPPPGEGIVAFGPARQPTWRFPLPLTVTVAAMIVFTFVVALPVLDIAAAGTYSVPRYDVVNELPVNVSAFVSLVFWNSSTPAY